MKIIHAMNDSPDFLPRVMAPLLERALASFPVVVLTGSRQTGKSTLVHHLHERGPRTYLTLDDLELLDRSRREPDALVRSASRLTLDEVQRSPDLLLAVKRAVDEKRVPGRFLLTGSANLLLSKQIAESLAGRAVYLTLWPFTRSEQEGKGGCGKWPELFAAADRDWPEVLEGEARREDWRELARRGGYPIPAHLLQDAEARTLWLAGYTQTYLERDLRDLAAVGSLVDFRRLMRAICLRLGNLADQTDLARDVGVSQSTVHRHLQLLETSYQLIRVPPFAVNRTKRLIKSPKIYWCDTALALHLAGETEPRGAHLENLVLNELLVWRHTQIEQPELLFWRTTSGDEVDFVVEWKGQLLPIEVKSGARVRLGELKGLQLFRQEYRDSCRAGLVLHDGEEQGWVAEGIYAAPWWRVF